MAKRRDDDEGGIVFSTGGDSFRWDDDNDSSDELIAPGKQDLRIHLDRLNGGKVATIIRGFRGPEAALEELGKTLKSKCGVGGTSKNGEILLQGDFRTKVKAELEKLGYRCKLAGG
jgi:translation initiation factor 1